MFARACWALALVLGCGPAVTSDDSGGGTGNDDDDTGSDTGAETGTGSTNSTTAMTTAMTTAETTAGTTAGTTVDPPGCASDFVTGCQSYCAAIVTCDPEQGPYEDCVTGCVDALVEQSAQCQQQFCEAFACIGALDCDALAAGNPECDALLEATDKACDIPEEKCFVGVGEGMCEYGCNGATERRMRCDSVSCVCFEDGIETSTCPIGSICDDAGMLEEFASVCCGW